MIALSQGVRLPPDPRSARHARRMLQDVLDAAPTVDAEVAETAILLVSELAENAILHAGTEFEVAARLADDGLTVSVTDRGSGPLEAHLAEPRRRYGRSASHGRGLAMVARLAAAWGTRHDADGRHTVWFTLAGEPGTDDGAVDSAAVVDPAGVGAAGAVAGVGAGVVGVVGAVGAGVVDAVAAIDVAAGPDASTHPVVGGAGLPGATVLSPSAPRRVSAEQAHRLLHVPTGLTDRLQPTELVEELARRLRDVLDAHAVVIVVDEGDGGGPAEVAHAGAAGMATDPALDVVLPVTAPLHGVIRLFGSGPLDDGAGDLVELVAYRIAMAVETRWLRAVDQHRRAWMAYLAEASELLGQSLDVELAVAVVPQVVVPRLGRWCAVHLVDPTAGAAPRLAALTHADENELPELRAALDPAQHPGPSASLRALLTRLVDSAPHAGPGTPGDTAAVRIAAPTDGLAVPLRARGVTIGTLMVGRPVGRPHSPEDVVLVADIARRAALAVHNAQSAAAHVAVSQALQQALLPRALPMAPGLELAAEYLPASRGSDVSGDFYDVLTIDPTRWLVSVGDVCGKGAHAAARTGLVRDVLRVLVRGGRDLIEAVTLLNEVMNEAADPLQFCTLAAAVVGRTTPGSPAGLDVTLLLAGHERPVLVRADGRAEQVGAFGTAVGLFPRVTVEVSTHHLAPGDALLLYTDGVTERRRGAEQFGPRRLIASAASMAGRSAREVVATVRDAVERFSVQPMTDDVALLAVRALP